ncbi:uncharacterized protein UTRI_10191 [Ustilago trichophora]|uniref:Uncharacterized protein n=1 Tax=Ustilago trichophora TaxID=86804 RepID=A0A5C3EC04_9BASI|nr:uncharacterized protein UTRI_10191 [Ustilago trichophora]
MRWNQGARLLQLCLGLAVVATATAPRYSEELNERMEGSSQNGPDDRIRFDQLHSRFFRHQPQASVPDAHTILSMYPGTPFFNDKPLFFADQDSYLSRAGLLQAYDLFGKVHVSNAEGTRHLTIWPDDGTLGLDSKPWMSDKLLDRFSAGIKVLENHFGRAVTLVSRGANLGQAVDEEGFETPEWPRVGASDAMPFDENLTKEYIRLLLRQKRFLNFSSRLEPEIKYGVRVDSFGGVQGRTFDREYVIYGEVMKLLRH